MIRTSGAHAGMKPGRFTSTGKTNRPVWAPWRQDARPPLLDAAQSPEPPAQANIPAQPDEGVEKLVFEIDTGSAPEAAYSPAAIDSPATSAEERISNHFAKKAASPSVQTKLTQADDESAGSVTPAHTPPSPPVEESFSFTPVEPSIVERVIETISGWPKLAAPFLVQNIGLVHRCFLFYRGHHFLGVLHNWFCKRTGCAGKS